MRVLCRTTDYVRWGGSGSDKIRLQRCLTKTKNKKNKGEIKDAFYWKGN